jgi:hypothetical protein
MVGVVSSFDDSWREEGRREVIEAGAIERLLGLGSTTQ